MKLVNLQHPLDNSPQFGQRYHIRAVTRAAARVRVGLEKNAINPDSGRGSGQRLDQRPVTSRCIPLSLEQYKITLCTVTPIRTLNSF